MRKTFVDTMTEISRKDPNVLLIIGDTGFSVFEEYEEEFKDRFINVGIAEQNFVGFSAGLAAMGMRPFAYNVVSFMTLRAMEQILLDVCYQENPVVLVGVGGGLAYGNAGPTHHSCQDIAMMRTLPNMTVICPGDPYEMRSAILKSYELNKPVYIRIGRSVDPKVHENDIYNQFKIGKAIKLRDGEDVAIFSTGCMLKETVRVCEILESMGVKAAHYSMHTVKPLDNETILQCADKYKGIYTIEEHSAIGGLGGAVSELLAQSDYANLIFKIFGFPDMFAPVTGSREYLLELYKMDPESIAKRILESLKQG
nr:transketolase C-terminal domain-containing protein [uncultured Aminipila sp.]